MTVNDLWKAGPIVQASPALNKDLQEQDLRGKIASLLCTYMEYVSEAHQPGNSCIEQMILCEALCYLVLEEKVCQQLLKILKLGIFWF